MNAPIDIVLPWVDGADPEWITEKELMKQKFQPEENSDRNIRFEDWGFLRYWFRAVEKFMPWVHKVFFVTWGHVPPFLSVEHPKLEITRHEDYIPGEYLPTYNSNTIEMNYHRIKGLSENFILFNDDMIPLQPIKETYYFENNKVCDEAVENIIVAAEIGQIANMARYTQVNNMMIINRHFNKRNVQENNWEKWYCPDYGELLERTKSLQYWYDFPGFHDPHMPSAMKKSTLKRLWELEGETLHTASKNHFRAYTDVTQYLVRYWQLCEGDFYPRRTLGKMCLVDKNNYEEIARDKKRQKWQMVSLNENCTPEEFVEISTVIGNAFASFLPEKSTFEK